MNANITTSEPTAIAIAEPAETATGGRRVGRAAVVWLPGLAVALGAAVATAHGLYEVALAARVPAGIAWLYPLITDGLALVAYAATARLHGPAARYAWSVVVLAAGLSGLAQAALLGADTTVDAPDGAAVRGRRLARDRRRHRRAPALPPGHPHHRRAHVESKCSGGTVQTGWCTARRERCSSSSCPASLGRARSTGPTYRCPASPPASSADDNVRRSDGQTIGTWSVPDSIDTGLGCQFG